MIYKTHAKVHPWRFYFVCCVLLMCVGCLLWRMFYLTVLNRPFLQKQGNARILRTVPIPAYRGMITDRNGRPLAISTPLESIWVNPQVIPLDEEHIKPLAVSLHFSYTQLKNYLWKNRHREFVYLRRQVNPAVAQQVKGLNLPGVHLVKEYHRYYPAGEVSAQVVGFNNIDDEGQEGVELAYNSLLRSEPGKRRVIKDRLGHIIADVDIVKPARPGEDLILSIDERIQYLAYRELKKSVEENDAQSGSAVVLDIKTGEVLAMVNQPTFNPNQRYRHGGDKYRNRAVTDLVEPASTVKPFTIANALASGKYTPASKVNTSPGWMVLDKKLVRDMHDNGVLDLTTILEKSSNMGVTKLTLSLPADSLWRMLQGVGFGEATGIHFPGETNGVLVYHRPWAPITLATLSFGYGMAASPLQLARAYAVLGAGGIKRPGSLLRKNQVPEGEQVLDPKVAKAVVAMLEAVVNQGTGKRARVPGYRVAGKTGTARMIGPNGYEKRHHIAIFAGLAPVSDPRLAIVVVVNDPTAGQYYGSVVAAPVFAKIMAGALRILDVPPDDEV